MISLTLSQVLPNPLLEKEFKQGERAWKILSRVGHGSLATPCKIKYLQVRTPAGHYFRVDKDK